MPTSPRSQRFCSNPGLWHLERKRRRQARAQTLAREVGRPFAGEILPASAATSPSAGFLKKLDTFIYERTTKRDFSGFPNYNPDLTPGCAPSQPDCDPNIGTFTTQDNGSGGEVYGLELSVSLDAGLFTPTLDGFGLILSTANTYNSLPKDENGNEINLDGFSSTVNSIEAYFERGGFSARISRYHRSAFTATTRSVLLNTLRSTHIDAEKPDRRADRLRVQLGHARGPDAAAAGEQPDQRARNHTAIARSRGLRRRRPMGLLPWLDDNYGRVLLLGASYKF